MVRISLSHEWRLIRATPSVSVALGFLAVAILFGAYNGGRWVEFQRQTMADARTYESTTYGELHRRAAFPDDGWPDPTDAASIGTFYGRPAVLPPAPLAPLAVGQSDVYPYNLYVSGKSLASAHLKAGEELGNPQAYVSGRFDLAFVLVVVLPLIVLAVLFDVISGERERGTLALLMAQPVSARRLFAVRVGLRWALVVGIALGASVLGIGLFGAAFGAEGVRAGIALLGLAIALYSAFWCVAALGVAGMGWGSTSNALALAGMWATLVLVVPGLIDIAARNLGPVPPRAQLVEAHRQVETNWGSRGGEVLVRYYAENPGSRPADFDPSVPNFPLHYTAVQGVMQDSLGPVLRQFDDALAAQVRLVRQAAVLSPAVVMQEALAGMAGTGHARFAAFYAQVEAFHSAHRAFFAPMAYAGTALQPADYERMPRFDFQEPSTAGFYRSVYGPLGVLAVMLLLCIVFVSRLPGLRRPVVR